MNRCMRGILVLLVVGGMTRLGWSNGFALPGLSAEGFGRGEAVIASPEDPATVWFNPGGMTRLDRTQVSVTYDSLFLPVKYTPTPNTGNILRTHDQYFPIPSVYLTMKLPDDRWAVGLAANPPFGLRTDWDNNGPFRYSTTGGRIGDTNIQPTVAYQVTDTLSLGAGIGIHVVSAELRSQFPWGLVVAGSPDGSFAVKGGGTGLGGTVGVHYRPTKEHSVGLVYRSQVVTSIKGGTATVNQIPVGVQALFSGSEFYSTGAQTSLRFPHTIGVGYAFRPTDRLLWELDVTWRKWNSAVKVLDITFDRPVAAVAFSNPSVPFNWRNSYVLGTGLKHQCNDTWSLSAGSIVSISPVHDRDYSALIPDNNYYALTLGAGYTRGNFRVNVPIVVASTFDRRRNPIDPLPGADERGIYRYNALHIALGLSYTF